MIVYSNSDSYGVVSDGKVYSDFVAEHYNARCINNGLSGACNRRIFRTALRDLLELGTDEEVLVLLSISTNYRFEVWGDRAISNDGHFNSVSMTNPQTEHDMAKMLVEHIDDEAETTNLFYELTLLINFLESRGYKFLIWAGHRTFKNVDYTAPFINSFYKAIENKVIPFDQFSFSKFCTDSGFTPIDFDEFGIHGHHGEAAHKLFAEHLITSYL